MNGGRWGPVAAVVTRDGAVVVVCDDGAVWLTKRLDKDLEWLELPPIPGTLQEDRLKDR